MNFIINIYKKNFLKRFDKDENIPYYSAEDFPGLICERGEFQNSDNITIKYFTYSYENPKEDKLILFCPGMGPGHSAYLAEIETLCKAGYKVLTLDYTGCGESGGTTMPSVNAPTKDTTELLNKIKQETKQTTITKEQQIIPIGHSLGGYTALNLINQNPDITKAVIISGFVSISDELMGYVKLRPLADIVRRFEKKQNPDFKDDNKTYIKTTTDKLLWIHSTDDPMANYKYNAGQVEKANNPNIKLIKTENKKHNPNYTGEALDNMTKWLGEYGSLTDPEAKKTFFSDKPIAQMTAQDPEIFTEILNFID
jgi:pimeloyl-ACP methyl ester carboxylesterase